MGSDPIYVSGPIYVSFIVNEQQADSDDNGIGDGCDAAPGVTYLRFDIDARHALIRQLAELFYKLAGAKVMT